MKIILVILFLVACAWVPKLGITWKADFELNFPWGKIKARIGTKWFISFRYGKTKTKIKITPKTLKNFFRVGPKAFIAPQNKEDKNNDD